MAGQHFSILSFYRLFPATKSTHHILEGALPHRITLVKSGGVCRLKRARVVIVFSTVLYNHDDDDQDERDDRRGEGEDQQLSPPRKGLGRLRRGRSVLLHNLPTICKLRAEGAPRDYYY